MSKDGLFFGNRISLTTLAMLVGNIIVGVWFASALNSRIATLELRAQNNIGAYDRLIRLETNFDNMKEAIVRIDSNLAKLADRERK